jgi:hypothetical protein
MIVPDAAPPPQAEVVREPLGTPWERQSETGLLGGLLHTLQEALFEPGKLFAEAKLNETGAQIGFAVIVISVASILEQLISLPFTGQSTQLITRFADTYLAGNPALPGLKQMLVQNQFTVKRLLIAVISAPLIAFVFLYLNAGVTHLFALLFGQSKRGFAATFAACAYGCAPCALLLIPGCGFPIAVVWTVVLTGIGLKITHGISAGGATATIVAPYLILCCLGLAAVAMLTMAIGQTMAGGG